MKFFYHDGATPIDDISNLKLHWVRTQEDLNQVETENISHAIGKYLLKSVSLPQKWFTVSVLKKIHREMFSDVWDWAGKFRTTQTIPGIKPYQISEALEVLCLDVRFWCSERSKLTVIEQSARIHHRLVFIHPFPNGNGRFSRLVSDRYLKALKFSYPSWPIDLGRDGRHREHYIETLKDADKGNYEPLVSYMKKYGAFDRSS